MAVLRARFDRVAAGVIRIEVDRPGPGRVVQTSPAVRIDLATADPALAGAVERLATIFDGAAVHAVVRESEAEVLWRKLVRLCALSCTTSAADAPLGYIRTDPRWRSALEGAINEASAVAIAEGAGVEAAGPLAELEAGAGRPRLLDAARHRGRADARARRHRRRGPARRGSPRDPLPDRALAGGSGRGAGRNRRPASYRGGVIRGASPGAGATTSSCATASTTSSSSSVAPWPCSPSQRTRN